MSQETLYRAILGLCRDWRRVDARIVKIEKAQDRARVRAEIEIEESQDRARVRAKIELEELQPLQGGA